VRVAIDGDVRAGEAAGQEGEVVGIDVVVLVEVGAGEAATEGPTGRRVDQRFDLRAGRVGGGDDREVLAEQVIPGVAVGLEGGDQFVDVLPAVDVAAQERSGGAVERVLLDDGRAVMVIVGCLAADDGLHAPTWGPWLSIVGQFCEAAGGVSPVVLESRGADQVGRSAKWPLQ
jgi:hypothetical protein